MEIALGFVIVLLLVAANGFFVAVEFALVASDRSKLQAKADAGSWPARAAVAAHRRMSFHLSGAQLGITVSSLVLGFLAAPLVGSMLEPLIGSDNPSLIAALSLAIATVFQMVAGELFPKNVAIARPEAMAMALSPAARIVHGILSPVIRMFNGAANWAVRKFGIEPQEELASVRSLEEFEYLIQSSGDSGTLEPEAMNLLTRTLRFGEKDAADALIPRVHVVGLSATATVGDLIDTALATGHSRYPIFGDDVDDVVGVASVGDVFSLAPDERARTPITEILREPNIVPETRDLDDILDDFRSGEGQLLVVVDEHGGTAGILTLEDVLEEITGDIDDEYDDTDSTVAPLTAARPGVSVVAGTLHPDEIEEATGFEIPDGDYETIAGFMLSRLGRIPHEGDQLRWNGWELEVVEMDRLRIASVQLVAPRAVPA